MKVVKINAIWCSGCLVMNKRYKVAEIVVSAVVLVLLIALSAVLAVLQIGVDTQCLPYVVRVVTKLCFA